MAGCQGEGSSLLHAPAQHPTCGTRGSSAGSCSCSRRSRDRPQYQLLARQSLLLVQEGEKLRADSKQAGLVLAVPRCVVVGLLSCSSTP